MTDPIDRLDADLARANGPTARLHLVAEFRVELEDLERRYAIRRAEAIAGARTEGLMTWRQIGDVLGVSLQRAHDLGAQTPDRRRAGPGAPRPLHPSRHTP